ncbi:helix-turn-helix domain-containing protein [Paenibacillus sp. Leaf72]|uniref:helix-turn-helix domain-containing protein n=1 Tax=Paenibacillus sp. Leaf72 TaxID=1736234 RepID=UPI0006FEC80D|nr:MerR family transcriptional regulator [Paenibacillus sp. Leaf72]KQN97750.1 transcriptional regulator [Paenibacillus sp. Leaf72]
MKNDITISSLAKLMHVSVHQIRYFEEKGILQPAYIDNNQYRMYGIDQIYRLSHILLLRRLGIPVSSIKDCFSTYSSEQYEQLLHTSLLETDQEIARLQELQLLIRKVLHEQQAFSTQNKPYQIKWQKPVHLKCWFAKAEQTKLHARLLSEQSDPVPDLFESDIYYVYEQSSTLKLCTETPEPSDLVLPSGDYLSAHFQVNDEEELEQRIEQLYGHAAAQAYVTEGPLIVIEKSYLSLFSHDKLHYELLIQVETALRAEQETKI